MSIVPREVVQQWNDDWYAMQAFRPPFRDYVANRAAEWALEQALDLCKAAASRQLERWGIRGNDIYLGAARQAEALEAAIRALLKGGESDAKRD